MYSQKARYGFIVLSLGLALFWFWQRDFIKGFLFIVAAGLFYWTLSRHGSVWRSFKQFEQGRMVEAQKMLEVCDISKWDNVNQVYAHFMKGKFASDALDLEQAQTHFEAVMPSHFKTEEHKGWFLLEQAILAYRMKQFDLTRAHLSAAKPLIKTTFYLEKINTLQNHLSEHS